MQPNADSLKFVSRSQVASTAIMPECGRRICLELAEKAKMLPPGPFRVVIVHQDGKVSLSRAMSTDERAKRFLRKFHGIYLGGR